MDYWGGRGAKGYVAPPTIIIWGGGLLPGPLFLRLCICLYEEIWKLYQRYPFYLFFIWGTVKRTYFPKFAFKHFFFELSEVCMLCFTELKDFLMNRVVMSPQAQQEDKTEVPVTAQVPDTSRQSPEVASDQSEDEF